MNAEEKKELRENDLLHVLENVRSVNRRKFALWTGVILLAFVGVVFVRWMGKESKLNDADRWAALQSTVDKDKLKLLIDKYRGKEPGAIAKMRYARILLTTDGLEKLATTDAKNRLAAADSIEEAKKLFLELTKELADNPTLAQEAWIDAATAEESLIAVPKSVDDSTSRGNFDQSISYLDGAAKLLPDSGITKQLIENIEAKKKKKDETIKFYTDLQKQLYVATLSDDPKLDLKDILPGPNLKAPTDTKAPEKKVEEKPADLKAPSPVEKKAEEKKPEPKKAEEKKPESNKAEEKK